MRNVGARLRRIERKLEAMKGKGRGQAIVWRGILRIEVPAGYDIDGWERTRARRLKDTFPEFDAEKWITEQRKARGAI